MNQEKIFKVKTGLKAGGDCPDMLREYQEKCQGAGAQGGGGNPAFAQAGRDIGNQWRNFGMSFIP
jgi:hypothetical protein